MNEEMNYKKYVGKIVEMDYRISIRPHTLIGRVTKVTKTSLEIEIIRDTFFKVLITINREVDMLSINWIKNIRVVSDEELPFLLLEWK